MDSLYLHYVHTPSTHFNLTFSDTNPQPLPGPYCPSLPPLPAPLLMIHSARCVKCPSARKKCFSVTYVTPVGIWTSCSPPHYLPCWDMEISLVYPSCVVITTFFDGYCSLLDWFEVDLGFTELSFIQIDLCVLCVFVLYPRVSLSSCPFWTFCTASPARWECL